MWRSCEPFVGILGNFAGSWYTLLLVSILTAWNFYRCRFVKTTVQGRAHKKLRSLEPWVTQLGRNGVLRAPKNRKWAHTLLGTLEPWFSLIDIDRNFRSSKCSQGAVCITTQQNSHYQAYKCKKWGHKKLGTLKPLVLRFSRNFFLKSPKCWQVTPEDLSTRCKNDAHRKPYSGV